MKLHRACLLLGILLSPAVLAGGESIVIEGADVQVTVQQLNDYIKLKVPEKYRYELMADTTEIEKLVRQLYKRKMLVSEARQLKLNNDPQVKLQVEYAQAAVLVKARLDRLINEQKPRNWDLVAREDYLAYPDKYQAPPSIHVSHILISREKHKPAELKQLAEKVLILASSGDEPFEQLAERFSEGPSAKKGGDLGFIQRGKMVKSFEQAAFKLKKQGELSPIVETKFGLHMIKLNDRKMAGKIPFEQIKNQIIEKKKQAFHAQLISDHVESIYVNAIMHREVIKGLQKPYSIGGQ